MSKLVLFRLKDDPFVWLVDLDAETVERRESDEVEDIMFATDERESDIDFAMVVRSRTPASQFYMYPQR